MSIATQTALNSYAQSLQAIENLETGIQKAISDFKALKDGAVSLDQLVITDNGWEFVPESPPIERNGAEERRVPDASAV